MLIRRAAAGKTERPVDVPGKMPGGTGLHWRGRQTRPSI